MINMKIKLKVGDVFYGVKNKALQEVTVEFLDDRKAQICFAPIDKDGVCIGSVTREMIEQNTFGRFGKTINEAKGKFFYNSHKTHREQKVEYLRKLKNNDDHLATALQSVFGNEDDVAKFIDKNPEYFV